MTFKQIATSHARQAGFSLIEIMIALGLSATLLFGVLQIFDANKQSGNLQQAYAEVQESGRIATEFIARDIRMADYWGCAPDSDSIYDHLDASDPDYAAMAGDLVGKDAIEGEDDIPAAPVKQINSITVKPATDTITLRGSLPMSGVKIVDPYMVEVSATIHLSIAPGVSVPKGAILMVSDCTGADRFSNTANNALNLATATTLKKVNLGHNTGSIGAGMVDNAIKKMSHTYTAGAQISTPFERTYFVGQNPSASWSLYRVDKGVASEIVRNVDDLQFSYGEDTNNDGSVDVYRDADVVADMDNVLAIKLSVATVSEGNITNASAGTFAPLERTYSLTINIRNRTL
ncbi:PilW family protein [Simiduia aestuariiviva]|uniref:Type IV pilus assembly protein PilW n=1 Tax=Simiduia aestuariiviva TaxID=1510459 RepID=A0A839UQR4_9GAMM|nr:PilW family protein [Simiduia aestuariiviva]MBB3170123.1 type IV pilus assembly protein PilW [Simiduia aestuariiviva]